MQKWPEKNSYKSYSKSIIKRILITDWGEKRKKKINITTKMTGVLNRNGINQNMTRDHRYFNLEHSSEFGFLNLRKFPILMSHGKDQC